MSCEYGLLVDYEFCSGCHSCEVACKRYLELPQSQWGIRILQDGPREKLDGTWEYNYLPMPTSLCDLCAKRTEIGKDPACVHNCPAHCMYFGTVEELAKLSAEKGCRALFTPVEA